METASPTAQLIVLSCILFTTFCGVPSYTLGVLPLTFNPLAWLSNMHLWVQIRIRPRAGPFTYSGYLRGNSTT